MERMSATRITWRDTLLMPEDGNRYEAIAGALYVTPAPTVRHQRVSKKLFTALVRLLEEAGYGEVLYAPVGVEFPDSAEGVQPDIVYVSRERSDIIGEDWIRGAPDLVVEVVSPSTAERDRTIKRKLYERHGVKQYWIVDPDTKTVEVCNFAARTEPAIFAERLTVLAAGTTIGEIDLTEVFSRQT